MSGASPDDGKREALQLLLPCRPMHAALDGHEEFIGWVLLYQRGHTIPGPAVNPLSSNTRERCEVFQRASLQATRAT